MSVLFWSADYLSLNISKDRANDDQLALRFCQKILNDSKFRHRYDERDKSLILGVLLERLESHETGRGRIIVSSNTYAILFEAVVLLATGLDTSLQSPLGYLLRNRDQHMRFKISSQRTEKYFSIASIVLSTAAFFGYQLPVFWFALVAFMLSFLAFIIEPSYFHYIAYWPASLYLTANAIMWDNSSAALRVLVTIPFLTLIPKGLSSLPSLLVFILGWILRYAYLDEFINRQSNLGPFWAQMIFNMITGGLQAPLLVRMVTTALPTLGSTLRALLLTSHCSKSITRKGMSLICIFRRLDSRWALSTAAWMSSDRPFNVIRETIISQWTKIVIHPESNYVGDILFVVVPVVVLGFACGVSMVLNRIF